MTFAAGSSHGLRYVAETTKGTTPSTPTMTKLRHEGCSLGVTKDNFQSNEIRDDRQISGLTHGVVSPGGSIDFELSYGEYDTLLEMAAFGEWDANVLKAGTTVKSATFERAFADIVKYAAFSGCMVDTFSLSVPSNNKVTGSFSLQGMGANAISGTPLDADPVASQTNTPFNTFDGTIKEGGATIAYVTSLDLSLANSLDPATVVGNDSIVDITPGRSNLTGTVSAFFESEDMLNKFLDETESSLEFTLGDGSTKSYTFLIPCIKYTSGGDINVSGEGRISLSMGFQALYDSSEDTNLKITRIPGA